MLQGPIQSPLPTFHLFTHAIPVKYSNNSPDQYMEHTEIGNNLVWIIVNWCCSTLQHVIMCQNVTMVTGCQTNETTSEYDLQVGRKRERERELVEFH